MVKIKTFVRLEKCEKFELQSSQVGTNYYNASHNFKIYMETIVIFLEILLIYNRVRQKNNTKGLGILNVKLFLPLVSE